MLARAPGSLVLYNFHLNFLLLLGLDGLNLTPIWFQAQVIHFVIVYSFLFRLHYQNFPV